MCAQSLDFKPVSAVLVIVCLLASMLLLPSSAHAVALGGRGLWRPMLPPSAARTMCGIVTSARQVAPSIRCGGPTYADDSSVCTAAVNAGVLNPNTGGTVIIEIQPGLKAYVGSTRHGVTTHPYGAWGGSYVFGLPTRAGKPRGQQERQSRPDGAVCRGQPWRATGCPRGDDARCVCRDCSRLSRWKPGGGRTQASHR